MPSAEYACVSVTGLDKEVCLWLKNVAQANGQSVSSLLRGWIIEKFNDFDRNTQPKLTRRNPTRKGTLLAKRLEDRAKEIVAQRAEGLTFQTIAALHGLSKQRVAVILDNIPIESD
jgi:hypothetical protein